MDPKSVSTVAITTIVMGVLLWQTVVTFFPLLCGYELRDVTALSGTARPESYMWGFGACCERWCNDGAYCCQPLTCYRAKVTVTIYDGDDYVRTCELEDDATSPTVDGALASLAARYPTNSTFTVWYGERQGCSWERSSEVCYSAYVVMIFCLGIALGSVFGCVGWLIQRQSPE